MTDYVSVRLECRPCNEDMTDLLAAYLVDIGYESFTPDEQGLTAYIPIDQFSRDSLSEVLNDFPMLADISIKVEEIRGKDWNEEWERNYFKPIVIADTCVIHSSFHKDVPKCKYDIVIDPKMAFGTGHHSTTSMMLQYLLSMDLIGKDVIDMGTGTGILAILAKMRGAGRIVGIEIDEGAYENACENAVLNGTDISFKHGDSNKLEDEIPVDIFIANINRNIILADFGRYVAKLKIGGELLLSGFYTEDIPIIANAASRMGMKVIEKREMKGEGETERKWAALRLKKCYE